MSNDEPKEPVMSDAWTTVYKGRRYFDTPDGNNQGSLRAERDYLRDWKRWAERRLKEQCNARG